MRDREFYVTRRAVIQFASHVLGKNVREYVDLPKHLVDRCIQGVLNLASSAEELNVAESVVFMRGFGRHLMRTLSGPGALEALRHANSPGRSGDFSWGRYHFSEDVVLVTREQSIVSVIVPTAEQLEMFYAVRSSVRGTETSGGSVEHESKPSITEPSKPTRLTMGRPGIYILVLDQAEFSGQDRVLAFLDRVGALDSDIYVEKKFLGQLPKLREQAAVITEERGEPDQLEFLWLLHALADLPRHKRAILVCGERLATVALGTLQGLLYREYGKLEVHPDRVYRFSSQRKLISEHVLD